MAKKAASPKKQELTLQAIGQQIRARRKDLGISSVVTAEAANISRVTLHRIEKGEPSVAMGAYLSVLFALGLSLDVKDLKKKAAPFTPQIKLPKRIKISNYAQLKRLAWQLKSTSTLSPEEALDIYERNWRHIDQDSLDDRERELIEALLASFGRRRLLV